MSDRRNAEAANTNKDKANASELKFLDVVF
jgi:hypothetical protein